MLRWAPLAAVFLLICVHPWKAEAQAQAQVEPSGGAAASGKDKAAREMFNAGRAAFNEGLFEDALSTFKRAYELSGRPQLLFNIGMAADSARHDAEALAAFEQYLREVPVADNRDYAQGRINTLKKAGERDKTAPAIAVMAPTPQPTAAPVSAPAAATAGDDKTDSGQHAGLLSKWWFWTIVGAGVAAITVTTVVVSNQDPTLQNGDVGGVIQTVRARP
jgi:hypothetical protein